MVSCSDSGRARRENLTLPGATELDDGGAADADAYGRRRGGGASLIVEAGPNQHAARARERKTTNRRLSIRGRAIRVGGGGRNWHGDRTRYDERGAEPDLHAASVELRGGVGRGPLSRCARCGGNEKDGEAEQPGHDARKTARSRAVDGEPTDAAVCASYQRDGRARRSPSVTRRVCGAHRRLRAAPVLARSTAAHRAGSGPTWSLR